MQLEPSQIANNPLKDLSPLQRKCYYLAVTVAFVSIFVWAIKILFL
jgi:hypothetical protein